MVVNTLIPPQHRRMFDMVPNFNETPLDSECGIACIELIVLASQLVGEMPDVTINSMDAGIWEAVALQCSIIING